MPSPSTPTSRPRTTARSEHTGTLSYGAKRAPAPKPRKGDRLVERILSIRETCRCQNRPLHPYLVDVHNARLSGAPIPTPLTT